MRKTVRFVIAHSRAGHLPVNLDWQNLAEAAIMTIFYMGGGTVGQIQTRLLAAGMDGRMPAVVVSAIIREN